MTFIVVVDRRRGRARAPIGAHDLSWLDSEAEVSAAAPRRSMRCRSVSSLTDPHRRARRSRTSQPVAATGTPAVLVDEAVERHVRRAVRGYVGGQTSSSIGPPRTRVGDPCHPLDDGGGVRDHRGRQRTRPARRRAHRLRRQHQPRAEDAGRRARRAGRGAGRRGRPGAVDRLAEQDGRARRIAPARTIDDLLELSRIELGGAAASEVVVRRRRRRRCRRAGTGCGRAALDITVDRRATDRRRSPCRRQPSPTGVGGRQPGRERRQVQRRRVGRSSSSRAATTAGSRSSSPTRASASRRATSTGSSSASTASTGPAAATPAAPGLGLSIVRHVATNHGGEVTVQSSEGRGLDVHASGSRRTQTVTRPSMDRRNLSFSSSRTRRASSRRLTIGLTPRGLSRGRGRATGSRRSTFDAVQPDLVLLDVMLPRISGIDVCRQLRKRSQVPIIMVTAKGAEIDTVVGLEVGADDYVTKPYRMRELVARMRAVLRRSPGDSAGELGAVARLARGRRRRARPRRAQGHDRRRATSRCR